MYNIDAKSYTQTVELFKPGNQRFCQFDTSLKLNISKNNSDHFFFNYKTLSLFWHEKCKFSDNNTNIFIYTNELRFFSLFVSFG